MIHDLKDSEKTWQIYLLYDLIYEPYKIYGSYIFIQIAQSCLFYDNFKF